MKMMDEDERARIAAEAKASANLESRLSTVEGKVEKILYGLAAAAMLIGTSIWDSIKVVLFK